MPRRLAYWHYQPRRQRALAVSGDLRAIGVVIDSRYRPAMACAKSLCAKVLR
jgi:hypothetical protein